MTAAHPPVPEIISEQRVAAELRTADDKLMTTQVAVGGGLIPYEPDIVDQYFEKPARRLPRLRLGAQPSALLMSKAAG